MSGAKKPTAKASARAPRPRPRPAKMGFTYERLRALAFGLDLPGVTEAVSWGQPCLKAHGKLWFFWNPTEDAPVFKVSFDERDHLIEMDSQTFFTTDHHRNWPLVLVRPDRLDADWARANLLRVWRDQAPKRLLKQFDASRKDPA